MLFYGNVKKDVVGCNVCAASFLVSSVVLFCLYSRSLLMRRMTLAATSVPLLYYIMSLYTMGLSRRAAMQLNSSQNRRGLESAVVVLKIRMCPKIPEHGVKRDDERDLVFEDSDALQAHSARMRSPIPRHTYRRSIGAARRGSLRGQLLHP